MTWCLIPNCQQPQNPDQANFCRGCGAKLLLIDRYRPSKILGRGGFGRTFLAIDEQVPSQPQCVIKQLFPQNQDSQHAKKAAELFQQEAMRLDQLEHPQIPKLLAHFTQAQHQYLIQTYIDGQTLAQEARSGVLNEAQARQLLLDLLPVLQFLHDRQIIHRDIKPENIVRRRANGQLVLVDFGASKFATVSNLNKTGTMIGSAGYAAPEQVGGKATFASDIYSLGVTCVHLLTGILPFDLYSFAEGAWIWRDYLQTAVSDGHSPVFDHRLGEILDQMIEPAVARRYTSAAAVLNDLGIQSVPPQTLFQLAIEPPEATSKDIAWNCIHTLSGHGHSVSSIAICPDRKKFASGSFDKTVKLWRLATGECVSTLKGHSEPVSSVAFSPNGARLISGSVDDTIRVWCTHTESLFYELEDRADSILSLSVAVSPDGKAIVSSSEDRTLKIWHLSSGQLLRTLSEARDVTSVAISPNGKLLVAGSCDDTVKLWSFPTGELLSSLSGHGRDVNAIAISPDSSTIASGSSDDTIRLWNLPHHSVSVLSGHRAAVKTVAFSPDGQYIASGSDDNTIKLWSAVSGNLLQTLEGHTKPVNAIAFASNSKTLVSGSRDRLIKIWCRG